MNKVVKPSDERSKAVRRGVTDPTDTRPCTRGLRGKELASLSDDDIDYSDIPEMTEDDFDSAILVPPGKLEISEEFMDRRDELEDLHPGVGSDGIDYGYLQPDDEFWGEATVENINEAMDRLVARRRIEIKNGLTRSCERSNKRKKIREAWKIDSSGRPQRNTKPKKSSSQVSA